MNKIITPNFSHLALNRERIRSTENVGNNSENFISIDEEEIKNIVDNPQNAYENQNIDELFLEIEQFPVLTNSDLINYLPNKNVKPSNLPPIQIESISTSPEKQNILGFYIFHLKALLIFLIFDGILKFSKNLIPRYCFAGNICDCSDNDFLIKI